MGLGNGVCQIAGEYRYTAMASYIDSQLPYSAEPSEERLVALRQLGGSDKDGLPGSQPGSL